MSGYAILVYGEIVFKDRRIKVIAEEIKSFFAGNCFEETYESKLVSFTILNWNFSKSIDEIKEFIEHYKGLPCVSEIYIQLWVLNENYVTIMLGDNQVEVCYV